MTATARLPSEFFPTAIIIAGNLLRHLDCAVINFLHTVVVKQKETLLDSVRATFPERDHIYPTAGFRTKNHIQICVLNPTRIGRYFYPID